jgi:hypothetical protein
MAGCRAAGHLRQHKRRAIGIAQVGWRLEKISPASSSAANRAIIE